MTEFNNTPEQLKQIAEWMGYDAEIEEFEERYASIPDSIRIENGEIVWDNSKYTPLTNPAQLLELVKKFGLETQAHICGDNDEWFIDFEVNKRYNCVEAKSFELAILKAVLVVVEEEKD